ncbi:hypothetical protein NIASO_13990 [Niabella soli DSM 19437]|uniref:Uncharacterized protein n=1 Tax=Niabella soli DSM 19437 TaxID=929713 RepID=W0F3Z0_9BACT|nr:hypothetical protein NIASO_13990 [Niabella soli DSM 19437]
MFFSLENEGNISLTKNKFYYVDRTQYFLTKPMAAYSRYQLLFFVPGLNFNALPACHLPIHP